MTRLPLHWLLPLLLATLLVGAAGWPPVVDEESYLDIAAQLAEHPARPYDWFRPWQPWGAERPEHAYLFAHPPLHLWWLSAWQRALPFGTGLRLAVGLPWALLLGWAAASLARRSGAPRGAWIWLASPVLVLGVQSSLMIDLPVVALGAAGLAAWQRAAQGGGRRWALSAGLLLGLAASTKYPALALIPVILLDAHRRHVLRLTLPALAGVGLTWGALELFLYGQYGAIHLIHVLSTADQIGRGPLLGRVAGTLARLGLLASPALALLCGARALGLGLASAAAVAAVTWGQLETAGVLGCAALAFAGGGMLAAALSVRSGPSGEGTRSEAPLLQLWLAASLLAVVLGHNYVGGRYLLPVALPLALLLALRLRHVSTPVFSVSVLLSAGLALAMSQAEARYARAAVDAADAAHAVALARGDAPGWFTGEWAFRWRMQSLGWRFYAGGALPPGALIARPAHASPGPLPEPLLLVERLQSSEAGGLKLIDLEAGVGYHAETLGPLPLGVTPGPLEQVELFEVP